MEVYANTLMLIQMCESEWGGYSSLIYKQCLNVKVAHLVKYLQNIHLIRPPVGISQFIQQGATSTCHQLSLWQLLCTVYTVSCNSTASVFVRLPCADCRSLSLYQMKATSVGFLVSRCRLSVNRKWAVGQGHGQVLQLSLGKGDIHLGEPLQVKRRAKATWRHRNRKDTLAETTS